MSVTLAATWASPGIDSSLSWSIPTSEYFPSKWTSFDPDQLGHDLLQTSCQAQMQNKGVQEALAANSAGDPDVRLVSQSLPGEVPSLYSSGAPLSRAEA